MWHQGCKKKEKLRKQQRSSSHQYFYFLEGKGATWEEKPLHQNRRVQSVRIKRVTMLCFREFEHIIRSCANITLKLQTSSMASFP